MRVEDIIILARQHIGGEHEESARRYLADATTQMYAGNMDAARYWALRSLAFSVGQGHEAYIRAAAKRGSKWSGGE